MKSMVPEFLSMMSPETFYHIQIILYMWSCDQSLVTSISVGEVIASIL